MAEILTLHFPDVVRVAGEVLQGSVDVNVPMALEDKVENVRIKLRGSIVTKMTEAKREMGPEGAKNETHYKTQTVQLLRIDQQIWDHFNSPQGAQLITCPFSIQLPPDLAPTFYYSHHTRTVAISYSIEVVGSRHGLFHANRKIRKIFSVVPAASPYELNAVAALRQGWNGPWKPIVNNRQLRHGIFGDYSEAKIELTVPDLPSFPMFTPIPFSFHVMTKTKPVHQNDLDHKGEKLFPAPPDSPDDIELVLHLLGHMRAHGSSEELNEKFELKGSLGDKASTANVRITTDEPVWTPLPDHKDKGTWQRGVRFDGLMTIPFAPTFSAQTAEWQYLLKYDIDFPGMGNHLGLEFPIHINSGCACPPPPMAPLRPKCPLRIPFTIGAATNDDFAC
ncbi:Arrestin-N domain-containing protein [Mycena venus]|uniref:Arrestin-N domain-containing protein n=1 Tax=Mycena venus TaxID=2733690 RepID=A0A8H7D7K8_9AGAR|nr:Arrestin-N domain-containing protein [Mycena venus]